MKVRMLVAISGVHDGEVWPDRGEVADVPSEVGKDLCAARLAEPLGEPEKPEKATVRKTAEKRA